MTGWRWWLVVGFTAALVFMFLWRRPPVAVTPSSPFLPGSGDAAIR